MAFKEEYEKFEVEFDAWSRQWDHDHPDAVAAHGSDDEIIGIVVKDGHSTAYLNLKVEQAEEVVTLIQAEIDKAKTWTPTEKQENH